MSQLCGFRLLYVIASPAQCAAHVARRLSSNRRTHAGLAMCPHHKIVLPPAVDIDELGCVACSLRSRNKSRDSGTSQPTMLPACEER